MGKGNLGRPGGAVVVVAAFIRPLPKCSATTAKPSGASRSSAQKRSGACGPRKVRVGVGVGVGWGCVRGWGVGGDGVVAVCWFVMVAVVGE